MKREDGFYWIRFKGNDGVGQWYDDLDIWYLAGSDRPRRDEDLEIGPRVQRDSEIVKQRDEVIAILHEALANIQLKASLGGVSGGKIEGYIVSALTILEEKP